MAVFVAISIYTTRIEPVELANLVSGVCSQRTRCVAAKSDNSEGMNTKLLMVWFATVSVILILAGIVFAFFGLGILPVERAVLLTWEMQSTARS
jgi:hypothetical protein